MERFAVSDGVPLEKLQTGSARGLNGMCSCCILGILNLQILHTSFLVQWSLCPEAGNILIRQYMLIQTNHIFSECFLFIHFSIHIIFFLSTIDFDTHEAQAIFATVGSQYSEETCHCPCMHRCVWITRKSIYASWHRLHQWTGLFNTPSLLYCRHMVKTSAITEIFIVEFLQVHVILRSKCM
jgi:hypothetical protein